MEHADHVLGLLAEMKAERDQLRQWQQNASKDFQRVAALLEGQPECQQGAGLIDCFVNYVKRLVAELEAARANAQEKEHANGERLKIAA